MASGKNESAISPWIKWLMFVFNIIFWIASIALIAVGIWAYTMTKELKANTGTDEGPKDVFDYLFDFTLVFIVLGVLVFVLSFLGALGSLRENICLLKTFSIVLTILFALEVIFAITVLALSGKVTTSLQEILKDKAIEDYRDDINRKNIIDWFQETFECCGVGDKGWRAWEDNKYFDCASPGFEACSVPYSCCQEEFRFKYDSEVIYTRCGHGMLNSTITRIDASKTIFVDGCVEAAKDAARRNVVNVGVVALVIVLPQVVGIAFGFILARQIEQQRSRWR